MVIFSKRLVLGLLVVSALYARASVTLNSTETLLTYTFSNLVSTTEDTGTSKLSGTPYDVSVSVASPGYAGSFEIRWYADYDSTTPFKTQLKSSDTSSTSTTSSSLLNWKTDLEGRFELEWLSGSRSISYVKIIIHDPAGNYYAQTMTIPDSLSGDTLNGTPLIWLYDLGYRGDYAAFDIEDPDNDGFLNWQEYATDTNPDNSSDFLSIEMVGELLNFESSSACQYGIEYCDGLTTENWRPLTNNIPGSGDMMTINPSITNPARYYRIVAERKPE